MAGQQIVVVVEDELSLALMERIVASSGQRFSIARRLIERGFGNIKRSVGKYRSASAVIPHVILTDLDQARCAAFLLKEWGASDLPASMLFRVAVREVESWILGDRHGFASFASIAFNKMPQEPEGLIDPKQTLVNLVRRSRNRRLATEIVPAQSSRAQIGPLYNERLAQFVHQSWDLEAACAACPSLQRTRERISTFLT